MYEKDKRSFFEKLTGTINIEEEDALEDSKAQQSVGAESVQFPREYAHDLPAQAGEDEPETQDEKEEDVKDEDGELAVDVYENENEIFVQAMIAGVKTEDLDVSITRDAVTIKGKRKNTTDVPDENYYNKELYWGGFSRKILLPEEIDPEISEAIEKHGLLILRLPKLNKKKSQKLEVKAL